MSKIVSGFLSDIAQEKNGYRIGDPWRYNEFSLAAIVPLLRANKAKRQYRLPSEVGAQLKVKDTGSISEMHILNKSEFPVLVKAGQILVGATQSRTLTHSTVIMPAEEVNVECCCVYSNKGIRADQEVKFGGFSPKKVRNAFYAGYQSSKGFSGGLREDGVRRMYTSSVQNDVWANVKDYSRDLADNAEDFGASINFMTEQTDLAGRLAESKERFDKVLKDIPLEANQVGCVLISVNGLESFESFDHTDSWKALRDSILGSEADKVSNMSKDNVFEYKAERAKSLIQKTLGLGYDEMVTVDKSSTTTVFLSKDKISGEIVLLHGEPICLSIISK
jgi:hypothetical protein